VAVVFAARLFGSDQPTPEQLQASPTPGIAAEATRTPTPFQPEATATPVTVTPTPILQWEGWATPINPYALTPIPYPLDPIGGGADDQPYDAYLILGSDFMSHRDTINTDVVALVLLWSDESAGNHISVISIPRDTYVFVPGWGMARVNAAYALLDEQAALDTIAYNFGITPRNYVALSMASFVSFIDYLGGVEITAGAAFFDQCGDFTIGINGGETRTLGGLSALCYARSRTSSSDFDRLRRQHEIMAGAFDALTIKAGSDPAGLAWQIYQTFFLDVDTDLTIQDGLGLAIFSAFTPKANIHFYSMVPPLVTRWIKPDTGAYLLVPPSAECLTDLFARALRGLPWLALGDFCPSG
jgi:LCP family protein required for cell wall assembly